MQGSFHPSPVGWACIRADDADRGAASSGSHPAGAAAERRARSRHQADGGADHRHRLARAAQGLDHARARDGPDPAAVAGERKADHRRLPAEPARAGQRAQLPAQQRRRDLRCRRVHARQLAQPGRDPHAGAGQRPAHGACRTGSVLGRRPELDPDRGRRTDRGAEGRSLGDLWLRRHRRRGEHHHSQEPQRHRAQCPVREHDEGRRTDVRCLAGHRPIRRLRELHLHRRLLPAGRLLAARPQLQPERPDLRLYSAALAAGRQQPHSARDHRDSAAARREPRS